ncbi:glycosyltransferase [Rhodopirellula sp. SWK7]|uniref:glycosyltransferase n=1 Tax=Rhodopirellula sp. SWK7 TaxID=595460 RepID=UPI0002BD9FF9|nr:glycosyltransferase [Rhodopirellula sp. SWK7]EMI45468.1 glycosyl transferase group 1 [Rhodopirellula sp. SWK7]
MTAASKPEERRIRALLVYHYIAKYREPIFNSLASDPSIEWIFASDKTCPNDIAILEDPHKCFPDRFITLTNRWVSKNILWQSGLLKVFLTGRHDAVVFLGDPNFLTTWICLAVARFSRRKTFLWTHGFVDNRSLLKDRLALLFFSLSNGLLLYGENAKTRLQNKGSDPRTLHIIYNSLDYPKQKQIREAITDEEKALTKSSLFEKADDPCFIFIGRLTYHKRLDLLVDLIAGLDKRSINANLLFVGDGEAADDLAQQSNDLGVSKKVAFFGASYDEATTGKLIASADACVSPGEIGLTAMHCLAYGTPVITHNDPMNQMPESEAVVDGFSGRLFEHDSFESLLSVTMDFLANPIPNIQTNCIQIIEEHYTPQVQASLIAKAILDE